MKRATRIIASIAGIACICATSGRSDIFMKQSIHNDASRVRESNQPETNVIVQTWLGMDVSRSDHGEAMSVIVRGDKKVKYILNHQKKTYFEIPMDLNKLAESSTTNNVPKHEPRVEKAEEGTFTGIRQYLSSTNVVVIETDEKQTIGQWKCQKYILTKDLPMGMGKNSNDVWMTQDTKIDLAAYWSTVNAQQAEFENEWREMKKIKGIIVRIDTMAHIGGKVLKQTVELLEIDDKPAPKGIYELPADYRSLKDSGWRLNKRPAGSSNNTQHLPASVLSHPNPPASRGR